MKTVLVTGISGLIARHTALAFLNAKYRVRGTLRDMSRVGELRETLSAHADTGALEFVEADLLADEGWDAAVAGCDCVAHTASPNPLIQPKDETVLVRPAVEGTLRVLRASHRHGVAHFVHTSSIFAVILGHSRDRSHFGAGDWTDLEGPGVTPYGKSKTQAERAARAFIRESGTAIRYASVNPGYVFGPALDRNINASTEMIRMFLAGKYPGAPHLCLPAVDVRDVAKSHLMAMEAGDTAGDRFLVVSECLWTVEITRALHDQLGDAGRKSPTRELPDWLVWLIGLIDPAARGIRSELGKQFDIDTRATRELLGTDFISGTESAIACAESLIELGLV